MKDRFLKLSIAASLLFPAGALAASKDQAAEGAKAVGAGADDSGLITSLNGIINTIFYVIGTLAVIILLVGAVRYITSTGDPKRIQQAKDTIFYAIAGLIVAILARAIVGFVISRV